MAKKYLQIQIPTPCSEDFSKMTSVEKGHFCNSCEKVVIDFSKMSDQEVANFYKKNEGKICGSFHPSQLNRDIRLTPPKVNSIMGKAAGLILTGVLSAAATNIAAQNIEVNPPITIVDSEDEIEKNEETESLKETVIRIKVISNFTLGEDGYNIQGATVTHLQTKTNSITNDKGIAVIRIPDFFNEGKELNFSINHHSFKTKELKLDADEMNKAFYEVELEFNIELLVFGWTIVTENDLPFNHPDYPRVMINEVPKNISNEEVKDFDFEKSNVYENNDLIKPLKSENSNPFEEEDQIISPLGVAIKKVYPNPFINRINIEVSTEMKGVIQINLIDISGRTVFQKLEQTKKGVQQFQIEVGNLSLSGNMYILQVQDESGNTQRQQLMRFTNHGFTMR